MEDLFDLSKFDSYKEDKDGNWHTTGLKNASKLKKIFWDTLNNRKKVSINLLKDDDVETFLVNDTDDVIMVIWVPRWEPIKTEHIG